MRNKLSDYIQLTPSEWMPVVVFKDKDGNVSSGMRTLLMQEMIKRGTFFLGLFVPCFSHTKEDIEYFAAAFDSSLKVYANAIESGFEKFLIGKEVKPVFRKYL